FNDTANTKQNSYTLVCGQNIIWSPSTFENGVNRIVLKTGCNSSNIVDIAFVVDATGSMSDEIQYLQAELKDIAEKVTTRFADVQFKWGSVFYRDHSDAYLTRHLPLQNGATPLIEFINRQSADGGGDFPEAVDEALKTALDSLGWSREARSRILFLVLDAPPHDDAKDRMNELVIKAAKKGIRIVPVVGSGIDKSTEYLMRCIALATNGSYVFLTDDSGIGGKHIKPTTDEFKVELLNDLLQRLIGEMIFLPACNAAETFVQRTAADSAKQILKVQLFPNPTSGKVTLRASQTLEQVYLTDFAGKILFRFNNQNGTQYTTDLGNYPSGTYLVKYFVKEKGWGSEKILLVH
ncbi:MAG: VWA domain-containing protein, partial [Chitinophagaceae bacterium]